MKVINLSKKAIVTGAGSLEYLKEIKSKKAMIVTGGQSMQKQGVIGMVVDYLSLGGANILVHDGIRKNPTIDQVMEGLEEMKRFQPDTVVAVGGGSAIDAMKGMVLFYEFPQLSFENVLVSEIPAERKKVEMIVVPSTSGTGSEVTRGTVITDTVKGIKIPIMTPCLKPDVAILDVNVVMRMPDNIVAETGMDALTHAVECYTNPGLEDFTEVIAKGAIEGLLKWLPISYEEKTMEAREKVHNYQSMAGIAFTNVGVGMVHGIAHAFGAQYNMAHGLANAVILPFVLEYNRRNPTVEEKLRRLASWCGVEDFVQTVKELKTRLQIPYCLRDTGLEESRFLADLDLLVEHSMLGATRVNPVAMTPESMREMIRALYYGSAIDF